MRIPCSTSTVKFSTWNNLALPSRLRLAVVLHFVFVLVIILRDKHLKLRVKELNLKVAVVLPTASLPKIPEREI